MTPSPTSNDLLGECRDKGKTIAVAESCTGGLLASELTRPVGASDVFLCGFVTYSNSAKHSLLGVPNLTIEKFGAVSEETARAMAQGTLEKSGADIALSITGIAGPGPSDFKPEGRVCFGLATRVGVTSETIEFGALGRDRVRNASVDHAIKTLLAACRSA